MLLPLVDPVPENFLKDFPGQNAVNQMLLDSYAGPCLTTHDLQTYTPVLSAVTTPPGLGTLSGTNGYIKGWYYRIFDQIYSWGEFRFGTGFSAGSGLYTVTLPFAVNSVVGSNISLGSAPVLGDGILWDDSLDSGRQPVTCSLRTANQIMFGVRMGTGGSDREVTHNSPVTWAVDDGVSWFVKYQRQS